MENSHSLFKEEIYNSLYISSQSYLVSPRLIRGGLYIGNNDTTGWYKPKKAFLHVQEAYFKRKVSYISNVRLAYVNFIYCTYIP